jgi:hypothetical protein
MSALALPPGVPAIRPGRELRSPRMADRKEIPGLTGGAFRALRMHGIAVRGLR